MFSLAYSKPLFWAIISLNIHHYGAFGDSNLPDSADPSRPSNSSDSSDTPDPSSSSEPQTDAAATAGANSPRETSDASLSERAIVVDAVSTSSESAPATSNTVDLRGAHGKSADTAALLERQTGVEIRRSAGLGSRGQLSVQGLADHQMRVFMDGIPLDMTPFARGVALVPPELVSQVELHKGVVPASLTSDAIGAAVDLQTVDDLRVNHGMVSYELASFATHRASASAHFVHHESGLFIAGDGYFDRAANDYEIDIEIPNDAGQPQPERVERANDEYRGGGGWLELGHLHPSRGHVLRARVHGYGLNAEIPHNPTMTVPYGEVNEGEQGLGAQLSWEAERVGAHGPKFALKTAYALRRVEFVDRSEHVYDWYGKRIAPRVVAGETAQRPGPTDLELAQRSVYIRVHLEQAIGPVLRVGLASSARMSSFAGNHRIAINPGGRDPLSARRLSLRSSHSLWVELTRVDHIEAPWTFQVGGSVHLRRMNAEQVLPGFRFEPRRHAETIPDLQLSGSWRPLTKLDFDALEIVLGYAWSARLPDAHELFGDGAFVAVNLDLHAERGHNVDAGLKLERWSINRWLGLDAQLNGFFRDRRDQIILLTHPHGASYHNLLRALTWGFESSLSCLLFAERLKIWGNLTHQVVRAAATEGPFANFHGDRIPNLPQFFTNFGATWQTLTGRGAFSHDRFTAEYSIRHVREFPLSWESQGAETHKRYVPSQWQHDLQLSYSIWHGGLGLAFALNNLIDHRQFDFYGVQRPGRSWSLELHGRW